MTKYHITVVKLISTVVEVEASSEYDARCYIKNYGLIEATSDWKVVSEDVTTRIAKAVRA